MESQHQKTVTFPGTEEIEQRLEAAHDDEHFIRDLYPIIAKKLAGVRRNGPGVVTTLALAIHDYGKDYPPMMSALAMQAVSIFIDALVDDKEVVQEAKDFFKEAMQKTA